MVELKINEERLWNSHIELAKIGSTPGGGVCRLALTDLDKDARNLFIEWCKNSGLAVRVDQMGNIFARREGRDPERPPVLTGSHLDTQPLGGRFDGAYGVLAGLEVVRALNDAEIETNAPIEVVVWTDEEGVRFAGGCMGVSVFAGEQTLEEALACRDKNGVSIGEELKNIGFDGSEPCKSFPVEAYFEAHIEQGPILEKEKKVIGVVGGAQGQRCFKVKVSGEEGHAGTLPMTQRKDAFQAAARMSTEIDEDANHSRVPAVITIGSVDVMPNSRNTIPGQTIFSIDSRCPDDNALQEIEVRMRSICQNVAKARAVQVLFERVSYTPPVKFDTKCIDSIRNTAKRLSLPHMDIYSGAGHDACHVSRVAPTGMIFVPCENGISHNEKESANARDLASGCLVLLDVMRKFAT